MSLKVWLYGFRCYDNAYYEFDAGKIHLVNGKSGKGKSTIFQAVTWCLYGTYQKTSHHTATNKDKMWVQVSVGDIVVYRQRNPVVLRVGVLPYGVNWDMKIPLPPYDHISSFTPYPIPVYEAQIAQNEIYQRFMGIDAWNTSSYIVQRSSNFLLEASATAKMDLMTKLAYPLDNPKEEIDRFTARIKQVELHLQSLQSTYTQANATYTQTLHRNNVNMGNYKSPEEIASIKTEIQTLTTSTQSLKTKTNSLIHSQGFREGYISQIRTKEVQLSSIPLVDVESVRDRRSKLSLFSMYNTLKSSLDKAKRDYDALVLPTLPEGSQIPPKRYTTMEISTLISQNNNRNNMISKVRSHNLPYDKDIISKEIDRLTDLLSHQHKYDINAILASYDFQIKQLQDTILRDSIDVDANVIRSKINTLELAKDDFPCPHCNNHIRMVGHKRAIKSESNYVFNQKEVDDLKSQLAKLEKVQKDISTLNTIQSQKKIYINSNKLDPNNPHLEIPPHIEKIDKKKITDTQQKISELKSIQYISVVDVSYHQLCNKWWDVKDKRDPLSKTLSDAQQAYDRFMSESNLKEAPRMVDIRQLETDEKYLSEMSSLSNEISNLKSLLSKLADPKVEIDQITSTIRDNDQKVMNLNAIVNSANITSMALDQYNALVKIQKDIVDNTTYLSNLNRFKERSIATQCSRLTGIVDRINSFIETYIQSIFTNPIQVWLSLSKNIKTTGIDKSQVTLNIIYEGGYGTDLHSINLSVGEAERVNLVLTLAMHVICGSGILILDETFVNIDADDKSKCNALIKELMKEEASPMSDSVVLIVSHEACEGFYDKIVEVIRS